MGYTFFILLLGALVFTLMQKHEIKSNNAWLSAEMEAMDRKTMGNGRDNIYQFKLYCYNMRCLLKLAQQDGVGKDEERDEVFYNKHREEISNKYCDGYNPQKWCMMQARKKIEKENYINSWHSSGLDDKESARMRLPHEPVTPGNYHNIWSVYPSEFSCVSSVGAMKQLNDVCLPLDGVTGADSILRALYIYNHAVTFGLSPYENSVYFYMNAHPTTKLNKKVLYFEESGITLYN